MIISFLRLPWTTLRELEEKEEQQQETQKTKTEAQTDNVPI